MILNLNGHSNYHTGFAHVNLYLGFDIRVNWVSSGSKNYGIPATTTVQDLMLCMMFASDFIKFDNNL